MDFSKFSKYLIFVALVGSVGSWIYMSSADGTSVAAKTFYKDEIDQRLAQAVKRAQQGFADDESATATGKILEARAERYRTGRTGLMIFAGLGVLALGMWVSSSSNQPRDNGAKPPAG